MARQTLKHNSRRTRPEAPLPSFGDNDLIILTGAGASKQVGLPTLDDWARYLTADESLSKTTRDTMHSIRARQTRSAAIEEVIAQLKKYQEISDLLTTDWVLRDALGSRPPSVDSGAFQRVWATALTECYRKLLEHYGPDKVSVDENLAQVAELLIALADLNPPSPEHKRVLHIYTTNYDCVLHVLASRRDDMDFATHIDNSDDGRGLFGDKWYYTRTDLEEGPPLFYVHRLHGCIAWVSSPNTHYRVREIFGAGERFEIRNEDALFQMCIKLTSSELIGMNPAFSLAFTEFQKHLDRCNVLLVWGHSFRDLEVLRTLNQALQSRKKPFTILYIDRYLDEGAVLENIRSTLSAAPGSLNSALRPRRVVWEPLEGVPALVSRIVEATRRK